MTDCAQETSAWCARTYLRSAAHASRNDLRQSAELGLDAAARPVLGGESAVGMLLAKRSPCDGTKAIATDRANFHLAIAVAAGVTAKRFGLRMLNSTELCAARQPLSPSCHEDWFMISFPNDLYFDKSPEERARLRALGKKLVERMLANPDLIPFTTTRDRVAEMLTNGDLDNPLFQDFRACHELYFELKEELARKGIQIFNARLEHEYSSAEVQKARAQKMVEYLRKHKNLLSADTIDEADLANPKFIAKTTYIMAWAWCLVWERKLAGIELYQQDADSDDRKLLAEIFAPLVRFKQEGVFS